jgi:hypothetical protein
MMAWLVRAGGIASVLVCIAASIFMNWSYQVGMAASPGEGQLLGGISVGFDVAKVVCAWVLVEHLAARRYGRAMFAGVFVVAFTAWALQSAIGFVAQTSGQVVGGREAIRASFADRERELGELAVRRKTITTLRGVGQIEAEMAAVLARTVGMNERGKSSVQTVAVLSSNCTRADVRTSEACGEHATLKQELAGAIEASRIDQRTTELRREVEKLRERGGHVDSNLQASFLSRLLRGWLSTGEIMLGQSLMLAVMLELWAAFGLVVLDQRAREAAKAITHGETVEARAVEVEPAAMVGPALEVVRPGDPAHFLAARFEIASRGRVARDSLFDLYKEWCTAEGLVAVEVKEFAAGFRAACAERGLKWAADKRKPDEVFLVGVRLGSGAVGEAA